jgi:hypothetical protein
MLGLATLALLSIVVAVAWMAIRPAPQRPRTSSAAFVAAYRRVPADRSLAFLLYGASGRVGFGIAAALAADERVAALAVVVRSREACAALLALGGNVKCLVQTDFVSPEAYQAIRREAEGSGIREIDGVIWALARPPAFIMAMFGARFCLVAACWRLTPGNNNRLVPG